MCKNLLALSLMACWPALASLVPLVDNHGIAEETRTEWLVNHLEALSLTSQSHFTDDSALPGGPTEFRIPQDLLPDVSGIVALDPAPSSLADDPFQKQPTAPSDTNPPGKLAFSLIILIGAIIRFLSSAAFRDFLLDVYSPLAPY